MFERLSDSGGSVLVLAQQEACRLEDNFIGTEHILVGLLQADEDVAARALQASGISIEAVRANLAQVVRSSGRSTTSSPPFTSRAKRVLDLSHREALQLGHNYIGTEHVLLGMLREREGLGATVLVNLGADLKRIRQDVIELVSGLSRDIEQWTAHRRRSDPR